MRGQRLEVLKGEDYGDHKVDVEEFQSFLTVSGDQKAVRKEESPDSSDLRPQTSHLTPHTPKERTPMNKIIFATGNKNKVRECHEILADLGTEIISMKEAGIFLDIVEDGKTFEENALIKARAVHAAAPDSIVIADDSGLCIDALNGEPGIYSARYLGEDTSYQIKNQKILERLDGVPEEKRSARFVCAMAVVMPDGEDFTTRGVMEGYIGDHAEGENGFGYDPIFFVKPYDCSSAVLSPDEKNAISHRGKAMRAMRERLKEMIENGGKR